MTASTKSIGIVFGGHLGDAILYSSVLQPLRKHFPDHEIIMIGSAPAMELFRHSTSIDSAVRILDLVFGPWKYFKIPKRYFLSKYTRYFWPTSLQVDQLIFPYFFCPWPNIDLLGAVKYRQSIGCTEGIYTIPEKHIPIWSSRIGNACRVKKPLAGFHVLDHIRDFLSYMGIPGITNDKLLNNIRAEFRTMLDHEHQGFSAEMPIVLPDGDYGVIFPGAKSKKELKSWPLSRYGEVLQQLGSRNPGSWLVCGSLDDESACLEVAKGIYKAAPFINTEVICGRPLPAIAAVLGKASLAIGIDNGGMHLAVAAGCLTVTVLGGMQANLYFPWGDRETNLVASVPMDCWCCAYKCRHEKALCIEDVSSEMVAKLCRKALVSRDVSQNEASISNECG